MRLKKILFLLLCLIALIGLQPVGHAASVFQSFDRNLENEIGYFNYQTVITRERIVQLPQNETSRINNIFNRLVAQTERKQEIKYRLEVVKDDSVNAFALPGGYIFVNTGLLSFAQSDAELAGVLGHEIGHIENRHSMKALYRTAGATVGWKVLMYRNQSKNKLNLNRLAGLSMTMVQLGYSREAEFEADRFGVELMQASGYNKQELINFWKRVESSSGGRNELNGIFKFFSTHPPLKERIDRIGLLE